MYKQGYVVDSKVTALSFKETVIEISEMVKNQESGYICICNTHSIVTASKSKYFNTALNEAKICTADGMPLVWALRLLGFKDQDRVDGPNLMLSLCEQAETQNLRIFLYGNTNETLEKLKNELCQRYPNINIVGMHSPPFRELADKEKSEIINQINDTKADLVFVSLGCPKQELWMYENKDEVKGVMLGVGAAFNFIIGDIKRPPIMLQRIGLEWFFRLLNDPKRLWKRYIKYNSLYILNFLKTAYRNKKRTEINH